MEKWREDFLKENRKDIALNLLKDGRMSTEKIAQIVGLSVEAVNELKEELIRDGVLPEEALVH